MKRLLLSSVVLLGVSACSSATPYVAANIASHHLNSSYNEFEEINPGISVGVDWTPSNWRYGGEAGLYRNSYGNRTIYTLSQTEYLISSKIGVGVFAGLAEYSELVNYHKSRGLPVVRDFVLIAGAMATYEPVSGYAIRVRVSPGGEAADAVFGLQFLFRFSNL